MLVPAGTYWCENYKSAQQRKIKTFQEPNKFLKSKYFYFLLYYYIFITKTTTVGASLFWRYPEANRTDILLWGARGSVIQKRNRLRPALRPLQAPRYTPLVTL